MRQVEKTIKRFEGYVPQLTKKPDHEAFWAETFQQTGKKPLNETLQEIDYPIKQAQAFELSYYGFDETPIQAYYILPREYAGKLPCLIIFHGYGANKHSVSDYMKWLIQGYAVIAIDCRGQGRSGDFSSYTSDEMGTWVTKGILKKEEYYYRKVYMDGVRAIDFACSRPEIDEERIAVMGASMGGGITLAVAALDDRPKLAIADVPNMCDLALALEQKLEGSLTKVESFLQRHPEYTEQVFANLTYFDNLNHVENITCRTRISVGLKDLICPPMTIFGIYNLIQAPKSIEVYPFSGHNVATVHHIDKTLQYVNEHL